MIEVDNEKSEIRESSKRNAMKAHELVKALCDHILDTTTETHVQNRFFEDVRKMQQSLSLLLITDLEIKKSRRTGGR